MIMGLVNGLILRDLIYSGLLSDYYCFSYTIFFGWIFNSTDLKSFFGATFYTLKIDVLVSFTDKSSSNSSLMMYRFFIGSACFSIAFSFMKLVAGWMGTIILSGWAK